MFKFWKAARREQAVETPPQANVYDFKAPLRNQFLTKGKWVHVNGRVGIYNGMTPNGMAEVHYVNLIGETESVNHESPGLLQVARLAQIPSARIAHLTEAQAAVLGYV